MNASQQLSPRCNISNFHSNHSKAVALRDDRGAAISQIFTQTTAKTVSALPSPLLQYLKFSLKPQRGLLSGQAGARCNISNFHSNHSGHGNLAHNVEAAISQIFTQTTAGTRRSRRRSRLQYLKFSLKPQPEVDPPMCRVSCNISNFHSNHSRRNGGHRHEDAAISQIFTQTTARNNGGNNAKLLQYLKFSLKPQPRGARGARLGCCNISNFHSNHSSIAALSRLLVAAISQIFTQTTAVSPAGLPCVKLQYLKFSLKPQHLQRLCGYGKRCNISNFHSNHSRLHIFEKLTIAAISQIFTQTTATPQRLLPRDVLQYLKSSLKPQRHTTAHAALPCCNISNFHSNHSRRRDLSRSVPAAISQIFTQTTALRPALTAAWKLQYLKFSLKPQLPMPFDEIARCCNISNFHSNHSNGSLVHEGHGAAISQIFTQTTADRLRDCCVFKLQYLKFSLKPQRPALSRRFSRGCNISNFHSNHSRRRCINRP